jgi:hypothetical protein
MSKYFYRYRSSVTGHWVSEAFALRNPSTTQRTRHLRKRKPN